MGWYDRDMSGLERTFNIYLTGLILIAVNLVVMIIFIRTKRTVNPAWYFAMGFAGCIVGALIYQLYEPYSMIGGGGGEYLVNNPGKFYFIIQASGFYVLLFVSFFKSKYTTSFSYLIMSILLIIWIITYWYIRSKDPENLPKNKYEEIWRKIHP